MEVDGLFNKLKERKKAGVNTLEMIVIVLIFILMFGFFLDVFFVLNQHYVASKEANVITRQLAVQGGTTHFTPHYTMYSGDTYITVPNFYHRVNSRIEGVGAEVNPRIYVTSYEENGAIGSSSALHDGNEIYMTYQQPFTVQLSYDYKWQIMGQMIPGMGGTRTRNIRRSSVSERDMGVNYGEPR